MARTRARSWRMANVGRLDCDSLAECLPDGRSSESLTFPEPTHAPGTYLVYVNLFDACGRGSARFTLSTTYRREQTDEGAIPPRAGASRHRGRPRAVGERRRRAGALRHRRDPLRSMREGRSMNIVDCLLRVALLGSSWVLWLLLALSVVSFAAMVERWLFFRKTAPTASALRDEALARRSIRRRPRRAPRRAREEPDRSRRRVLREALRVEARRPRGVRRRGRERARRARAELERGMNLLGTLGNNAPFIGLFGTVLGVIEAFHQLGAARAKAAMGNVMSGIAEALVATGVGLFVAIPAGVALRRRRPSSARRCRRRPRGSRRRGRRRWRPAPRRCRS